MNFPYLYIFLFLAVLAEVQVNQCVLRCKDNHMRDTMDNEWSTDFTLPILNLLKTTGNETAAYLRAREICSGNSLLEGCLNTCNASREIEIIKTGLATWKDTCENLDDIRSQFPCWMQHGDQFTTACGRSTKQLRQSMEYFARNMSMDVLQTVCGDFDKFSNCFISEHGKNCGFTSEQLTAHMFSVNKEAIFRMLKLRFTSLPSQCSANVLRRDINYAELFKKSSQIQLTSIVSTIIFSMLFVSF